MEQTEARRRAEELGGIAVGAKWSVAKQRWITGGYSPHPEWIVVDINHAVVLDDGCSGKYPLDNEDETHDDRTISRVRSALQEVGLDEPTIIDAINSMQNAGILFRERA